MRPRITTGSNSTTVYVLESIEPVESGDVMAQRYIDNEITFDELNHWANGVCYRHMDLPRDEWDVVAGAWMMVIFDAHAAMDPYMFKNVVTEDVVRSAIQSALDKFKTEGTP